MADVFISYANEDRDAASALATWLQARGLDVWWDRRIRAGESFDVVIEREIESARSVVVLWSAQSTASEWVRNEAALAAERGVLVPVFIERVKPPLEFRRRQTIDLIGWQGDPDHPGLQSLTDALSIPPTGDSTLDREQRREVRPWPKWAIAAAAAAVLTLGAYAAYKAWSPGSGDDPRKEAQAPADAAPPTDPAANKGSSASSATDGAKAPPPRSNVASAPDVTGFWDFAPVEGRRRKYLELKLLDGTLLGQEVIGYEQDALTTSSGIRKQAPILDGKVEGNRISFSTRRVYIRNLSDPSTKTESVNRYNGVIAGDKIHFTYSNESAGEYWEETAERRPAFKGAERVARLKEHTGTVESIVPLPGGRFASASRDRRVIVWNIATMGVESKLDHDNQVWSAAALPNERIATAENNGRVQAWDLQTQRVAVKFAPRAGRLARIVVLDDGRVAGAYSDGSIAIWNSTTGAIDMVLKADDKAVRRLAALNDERLAAGGEDGAIRVWNTRTGQAEATVRQGRAGSSQDVTALLEIAEGRLAFSTLQNKSVEIARLGSRAGAFELLPSRVGQGVEWIARGRGGRIHVLEAENVLSTWTLATRKEENAFEVGADPYAASVVAELPDGRLVVGLGDGAIEVWRLRQ
ncbi:MAG TPA: TIR domain-containing protein [Gemmatimonadales bacterium]|nr:TIR domain-containing protein [Gemmatimonadales bacterium]